MPHVVEYELHIDDYISFWEKYIPRANIDIPRPVSDIIQMDPLIIDGILMWNLIENKRWNIWLVNSSGISNYLNYVTINVQKNEKKVMIISQYLLYAFCTHGTTYPKRKLKFYLKLYMALSHSQL